MKPKETPKNPGETEEGRLDRFKRELAADADIMEEQAEAANEDMRFINVDGAMWENFQDGLGQPYCDDNRAKLQFDLTSDHINRNVGQWNLNRVDVEFKPDDESTTDDDAELLNGIYRADYREGSGKLAVDNAVDEVFTVGYGCFKLAERFVDEEDPENDLQRIEWRPIHNAYNLVMWDQGAKRIDKADARHVTELVPFTKKSFEASYPGETPVSAYCPQSDSFFDLGSQDLIYIAVRYEIVRRKETFYVYNNLQTGEVESYTEKEHKEREADLKKDDFIRFKRKRKKLVQFVEKSVFSGDKLLDPPKRIAGKYLPIIPIYGYRAYVDGIERYKGLVRALKDPQRLHNMVMSKVAEHSAAAAQEKPIFDPSQIPNSLKPFWENPDRYSYLLSNAMRDDNNNIVSVGPQAYLKPPVMDQATVALMEAVPAHIRTVSGGAPQDTLDPDASGKAIVALMKRENLNTQPIQDNIANAIERCGTVYASKAAELYTTQRMMRTIGKDGTAGTAILNKLTLDDKTGILKTVNTFDGKKFNAYSDIGPQYDTLREERVETMKGTIELIGRMQSPAAAEYLPAALAVLFSESGGSEMQPLRDLARKQMLLMGLVEPKTDEDKKIMAEAQQQAATPDAQQQLLAAAAAQQQAEARNLDASSQDKLAAAEKKTAETAQIISETENAKILTLEDIRDRVFNRINKLPLERVG